jgi:hypothetical protein
VERRKISVGGWEFYTAAQQIFSGVMPVMGVALQIGAVGIAGSCVTGINV